MDRPEWRRFLPIVGATVLATACGGGSDVPSVPPAPIPTPTPPTPQPELLLPEDPSAVILEVWVEGGFAPLEYTLGQPPVYWLTAGGALYLEGPGGSLPLDMPEPILPDLRETEISDERRGSVFEKIAASGLPEVASPEMIEPTTAVPEVLSVEFVFRDTAGVHVIRVEGLRERHSDPRVTHLGELIDELSAAGEDSVPFEGDRVQVIVGFDLPPPPPGYLKEQPWPLPEPPARSADERFPCLVFEGAEAARLLAVFGETDRDTRWVWEDERIQLLARPLFPGEEGCRE